jgi:hypothetical protein
MELLEADIHDIVDDEGLDELYTDDVSRNAIIFFKQKGISINILLGWQKKYPIIYPWDDDYNSLRLGFNRVNQIFPKMLVRIKTRKDVQWALRVATKYDIKFTIRSGSHCSNNYSLCNGIVIDVSQRNYIKHCKDNVIKIGAGVLLGPLIEDLNSKGLFLPTGSCASVSVTGLSLGLGIGYLRRKFGVTLDSMLSATIILANGSIVKTDKNNYPDLFWAIRGAGNGNFGVITDLTLQTYKLSRIALYDLWIPFCHFRTALDTWQRWISEQTNNLTSFIYLYPKNDKHKKEAIYISGQFDGTKTELKKLLQPFDEMISSSKIWYTNLVDCEIHNFNPNPPLFYSYLNLFATEYLSRKAIKNLEHIMKNASDKVSIEIDAMGGKISEISKKDTAFFWRDSLMWILIRGATDDQEELKEPAKWVRSTYNQLLDDGLRNPKTGLGRIYSNFKDPELTEKEYPLAYWGDNAKRLMKIKAKYDPNNMFKFAQSIPLK